MISLRKFKKVLFYESLRFEIYDPNFLDFIVLEIFGFGTQIASILAFEFLQIIVHLFNRNFPEISEYYQTLSMSSRMPRSRTHRIRCLQGLDK